MIPGNSNIRGLEGLTKHEIEEIIPNREKRRPEIDNCPGLCLKIRFNPIFLSPWFLTHIF